MPFEHSDLPPTGDGALPSLGLALNFEEFDKYHSVCDIGLSLATLALSRDHLQYSEVIDSIILFSKRLTDCVCLLKAMSACLSPNRVSHAVFNMFDRSFSALHNLFASAVSSRAAA